MRDSELRKGGEWLAEKVDAHLANVCGGGLFGGTITCSRRD